MSFEFFAHLGILGYIQHKLACILIEFCNEVVLIELCNFAEIHCLAPAGNKKMTTLLL